MNIFTFVILSLATWRVSKLLTGEAGPFNVFLKIRKASGIVHLDYTPYQIPDTFFAQLLSCVWCTSVWVGTLWFVAWYLAPKETELIAIPLALSAVAILFESHISPK